MEDVDQAQALKSAITTWHQLLGTDEGLALESASQLEAALRRENLVFGDRQLCTVLRPRFFTPEGYRDLRDRLAALMGAFRAAHERAIADPVARAQFRLTDWEEQLIREDKSGIYPGPTTRIDSFLDGEAIAVTEFNGETPAGAAYNDALAAAFSDLPVTRKFAETYAITPLEARHGVVNALLDAYAKWSGSGAAPRIAILDWRDVATRAEFELFRKYFESRGLSCTIGDPRDCEYSGGKLRLNGDVIDLIYKRVLIDELVEETGLEGPVVRAVRDNAVCMLNGFRAKILHKKASLAVLSDERNASWFDATATHAIRSTIPWTRVVEARKTQSPDGASIDLLCWMHDNRNRLVLKPNDDYGGAGIVLGWTVDDAAWTAAITKAQAEPYIVQQRVSIPKEPYPSIVDGKVAFINRQVDTAPFVCDWRYVEGVLSRLSTAELLNVTAGGGSQTPTFIVEPR